MLENQNVMANKKEDDKQLEAILSEINEGIKKGDKPIKEKSEKAPKADSERQPKAEKPKKEKTPTEKKPATPKPKKEPKPINYDRDSQMSFAKAATIIEDAMDDLVDSDDIPEDEANITQDGDSASHLHHIAVTHGEMVETPESEKPPQPEVVPTKRISKAQLKKDNGTAVSRPVKERPTKKQKRTMILGICLSFFVIVGVFSTIWGAVSITNEIVNATSLKEELARVIFPLVIIDTPEFDTSTKLDNSAIISSAIWAFIIDENNDKSKYRTDDLGSIFVPDTDIETYIRQMYGADVKITHQSVDDAGIQMSYSPETKTYITEATPKSLPYTPRIDELKKTGDIYTLRVGYILPSVFWNLDQDISKSIPDKIMEYKLLKTGETYRITSVTLKEIAKVPEGTKQESNPLEGEEGVPGEVPEGDIGVLPEDTIDGTDGADTAVTSSVSADAATTSSAVQSDGRAAGASSATN